MWRNRQLCPGLALGPAIFCPALSCFVGLLLPWSLPGTAGRELLPICAIHPALPCSSLLFPALLIPLGLQAVFV